MIRRMSAKPPALKTRKPTGVPPLPFVVLGGIGKSGKSYAAADLTRDERVGNAFWLDLGEGAADEYAALPGARYDVIDHDGTYRDIAGQVAAVIAQPRDELGRPNVLIIDTISGLWSMLSDMADAEARASKKGQQMLRDDPNAEVTVTQDKWNQAKKRWRKVADSLLAWQDGIVIALARADDVTLVENGAPVVDKRTKQPVRVWKVQGEKTLTNDATVVVRCVEPGYAEVVGARTLCFDKPASPERPYCMEGFKLADLLFDVLGISAESTGRQITALSTDPQDDDDQPAPAQRSRSARPPADEPAESFCDQVAREAVALKARGEQGDAQAAAAADAVRAFLAGRKFVDLKDGELRQLQQLMAEHAAPFDGAADTEAAEQADETPAAPATDETEAPDGDEPDAGPADDDAFTGGDIDAWVHWASEWGFSEDEFMVIFTEKAGVEDIGEVEHLTDDDVQAIKVIVDVEWRTPADAA